MYHYIRIRDDKESTFDSLENKCNALAYDGYRVIDITNGDTYRTATLEKQIDTTITNKQDSERSGLPIDSTKTATRSGSVKARVSRNNTNT